MVGSTLGPYEILEPLGKGGMGEVYLAEDTRLDRKVALKVLPPELAGDPERRARFEREARAAAALNHPHIAAVFDVGAEQIEDGSGPLHFIVQEHLEGQSLRDRLDEGKIPLDTALELAVEVGEALVAAHRAGIVHRDLKPENIFVTDEGHAKVLDFGLAKLTEPAAPPSPGNGASRSPTALGTGAGQIMGTAGYMAPEQVNGETVDHRVDLFAFGSVLYEMLAGRRAFPGERPVDILHAIVRAEPRPLAEIDDGLPRDLYRIVGKCLAKDPTRRYQATGDLVVDLRALPTTADPVDATPVISRPPEPSRRIGPAQALALVVLGALLGIAATAVWLWRGADPPEPARIFQIDTSADLSGPQVAPDGHAVTYVRNGRLVVRNLERLETEELEGTDGASRPFWSPDSASIGYFVEGGREVRVVSELGGPGREIADDTFAPFGAAWCGDEVIYGRWGRGFWATSGDGRSRQLLPLDRDSGQVNLWHPHCLPGGRVLAILESRSPSRAAIVVIDGEQQTVLFGVAEQSIDRPQFVAPDTILFEREGDLWRLPVSSGLSEAAAPPTLVLAGAFAPSVSADGLLVAMSGVNSTERELVWVDRSGVRLSRFGRQQRYFGEVAVAPGGGRVAATSEAPGGEGHETIFIHRENAVQPLDEHGPSISLISPAWSHDGTLLAYSRLDQAAREVEVHVRPATGAGDPDAVGVFGIPVSWLPDGEGLVFEDPLGYYDEDGGIWVVGLEESATPRKLLSGAREAALSPDGRWLAYVSWTSGEPQVYLTTFPERGPVVPVSGGFGRHPRWNPRGGELFYAGGPPVGADPNLHGELYAVAVDADGTVGSPRRLFDALELGFRLTFRGQRGYDVGPDGERIVVQTTGLVGTPTILAIDDVRAWMGLPPVRRAPF